MKIVTEIHRSVAAMPRKDAPSIRILRREWSKQLRDLPGIAIIALAQRLVRLGPWERALAYELIFHHPGALEALKPNGVTLLGRGIHSWGEVDSFASYIAGPAWRQKNIPDNMVRRWAHSRNRWWRRAALVSTVPLNDGAHGGTGNTFDRAQEPPAFGSILSGKP